MPLRRRYLDVPIGGGMNDVVAEALLDPPFVRLAENAVISKDGEYEKRNGYERITSTGVTGAISSAIGNGDDLLMVGQHGTWGRVQSAGAWRQPLVSTPHLPYPCQVERDEILRQSQSADQPDMAVTGSGTYLVIAYRVGGNIRAIVYERSTLAIVQEATLFGGAVWQNPRLAAVGATRVILVVHDTATPAMQAVVLDTAAPLGAWSAAQIVHGAVAPGAVLGSSDLIGDPDNTHAHLAFPAVGGAGNLELRQLNVPNIEAGAGAFVDQTVSLASSVNAGVALFYQTAATPRLIIGLAAQAAVDTRVYAVDAATYLNPVGPVSAGAFIGTGVRNVTIAPRRGGGQWIIWDETSDAIFPGGGAPGGDTDCLRWRSINDAVIVGATVETFYNLALCGKAFGSAADAPNTLATIPVTHMWDGNTALPDGTAVGRSLQPTSFLVFPWGDTVNGGTGMAQMARYHQERADEPALPGARGLPSAAVIGAQVTQVQQAVAEFDPRNVSAFVAGIDLMRFTFGSRVPRATVGRSIFLAAGMLATHDGVMGTEHAPQLYPEQPYVTFAGGAAIPNAATRRWCVVFVLHFADGTIARSAPSPIREATNGAGVARDATIWISQLDVTAYRTAGIRLVSVEVYRTANGTTGNYLLTFSGVPIGSVIGGVWNVIDTTTDAILASRAVLYTDSGELPAVAPPPFRDVHVSGDRMWGISGEAPNEVWYSKPFSPGFAPEFASAQRMTVGTSREKLRGIRSLDEKIVMFGSRAIYALVGAGPDVTGTPLDAFTQPVTVASDVGLARNGPTLQTPIGIMFASEQGIYLLDRAMQAINVGAAVEDQTIGASGLATTPTAAVFEENRGLAIFFYSARAVVYDVRRSAWLTWTGHTNIVDATVWGGRIFWTDFDGVGRRLKLDTHALPGADEDTAGVATYVPTTVRFCWMKLAGLQGYQRIYRVALLGTRVDAHDLTVRLRFDHDAATVDTASFTGAQLAALPRYQVTIGPSRQKTQSIQVEMVDAQSGASPGRGYRISGLGLLYGVKGRIFTVPAAAKR